MGLYEEELDKLTAPYPGCLYASFIYEAQLFDENTLRVTREVFSDWTARIMGKLEEVMRLYRPRLPVDLKTLAEMSLVQAEAPISSRRCSATPRRWRRSSGITGTTWNCCLCLPIAPQPRIAGV